MIVVEIPAPRGGTWCGVMVQWIDVAGASLLTVTVRPMGGRAATRQWFSDEGQALTYALGQADARNLPLFDLRDGEAE